MPKKNILRPHQRTALILDVIAASVACTGLLTISGVLFAQSRLKYNEIVSLDAHITLLVGLTFIYLATLLRRGKHTAWIIALPLYSYIMLRNIRHFLFDVPVGIHSPLLIVLNIVVPGIALIGLIVGYKYFVVRSELATFTIALRRALLVLVIAFLYGFVGFQLMDEHDFHHEILPATGAHYTIDQLNITTSQQLSPHTRRAKLFLDSLATLSLGSLFYVGVSLFAPIRFRLSDQRHNRANATALLQKHGGDSEDFFKLWPHDKAYFFNSKRTAFLAYRVTYNVALVVGDPIGEMKHFKKLIIDFTNYCHINDWEISFIHIQNKYAKLYKSLGFDMQKIGEEAIIELADFNENVANNKYFRNIKNRFERQKYTCKIFVPPHDKVFLKKIRSISDQWLEAPGRSERGFMMGYFSNDYMQQCNIAVALDVNQNTQAFINQIPSYDFSEANFDFLRSSNKAPGNVNDFLMLNFINYLNEQNFKRLNMGLAPLVDKRVEETDAETTALDSALQFIYSAGGRFYSFAGLKRFKDKYEPNWQSRYIAYQGGLRGFTRSLNAIVRAMKV